MKLKDKALLVIEALAMDDLMEALAMRPPQDELTATLAEKLGAIYRYAHVASNPSCIASHDNWIKEVKRIYAKFHKAGIF